jgi:hypothetical protein
MIRGVAVVVALSSGLAVAGLAAGSDAQPERRAHLTVVTTQPLVLRGTGFLAAEKVRLTVVADGERMVRRPTTGRTGRFLQRLPTVSLDRCEPVVAVAIGSRGSRASIKPFQLGCPIPLRGSQ